MSPTPNSDRAADAKHANGKDQPPPVDNSGKHADKAESPHTMLGTGWGNLLVIEHRLADGSYVTSVYGHLAKRLVSVGDIVQAGQVIGMVGRKGIENGGYNPHLHFGIREGRMFEPGANLVTLHVDGKPSPVKLASLREDEVEIEYDESLPESLSISAHNQNYSSSTRDGKHFLPAGILNHLPRREFAIVGYGLTTDGWREPTDFLREMRADTQPAALGKTPKGIAAKPRD